MEFAWKPQHEAYRKELRDLIAANLPADWWEKYAYDFPAKPELMQFARKFGPELAKHGHVVSHWPKEYGGRDSEAWEHIIMSEEMWSEGEPRSSLYMGQNWAGPAILMFGTEEQKAIHLNRIASGSVLWCQGFSEPEAGSDLASMRTRAEPQPDRTYIVNGRKIWTSYAHEADWMFLLARVGTSGRGGVSCFLVDMKNTPGITAKTIPALHSEHDFHETTFDNAHLPATARLGAEGKGWDVVTTLLHHERVGAAHYEMMQRALDRAVEILKERGQFSDPVVRTRAASVWAATEAARVLTYRIVDQRVKRMPPTAFTSIVRVSMIRSNHDFANFLTTFLPDVLVHGPSMDGRLMLAFKWALGSGMASGAAEVQLNLISGRHLHLPKED